MAQNKTAETKDNIKEARTQLMHRYFVSLIYNSVQSLAGDNGSMVDDLYQVYTLDFLITSDNRFHSWDIVLYRKTQDQDCASVVFVEVKSQAKNLVVESYREKVKQTMELLVESFEGPLKIKIDDELVNVCCVEFVIAAPPSEIGHLRNRFTETPYKNPVILWQIDDGTRVHQSGKVAHVSIPYVAETRIKSFPNCKSRRNSHREENEPLMADFSNEWFNTEIEREKNENGNLLFPQDNLTKNNDDDLLNFLSSPNVISKNYVPGRIPMIQHAVNVAVLYKNGPLSRKGKDLSKAEFEWIRDIEDFFAGFGLGGIEYGEIYVKMLKGIGRLKQSELNPNSLYLSKPKSNDPTKLIDALVPKIMKYIESEHTGKIV